MRSVRPCEAKEGERNEGAGQDQQREAGSRRRRGSRPCQHRAHLSAAFLVGRPTCQSRARGTLVHVRPLAKVVGWGEGRRRYGRPL